MGRVKEPENGHKGKLQWTCADDNSTEVKRSIINVQGTALSVTNSVTKLTERRLNGPVHS